MRRRSWAHSIREPPGFTTPSPRLVRGRLRAAFSLSRPRSGNVPSPLATNGDASSGVFAIFFLARGNVAVAPALAGPRGTRCRAQQRARPEYPRRFEAASFRSALRRRRPKRRSASAGEAGDAPGAAVEPAKDGTPS
ncbi:MAG: hypothetical protein ABI134_29830 [Byssovorax sp.]